MKPVISTPRADVYCAGFEDVAPTLADGSATLGLLAGPYNCRKAEWDKVPSGSYPHRPRPTTNSVSTP